MSPASSSRWAAATRARCSSTSGRRPAFHASMNSLRTRSGSGGTEDPLQFDQAAAAALVDVVDGDAQARGDGLGVELLEPRELEDGAVVVVAHLGDAPPGEALGLLATGLGLGRLLGLGAQLLVVAGERRVVGAALAAVVPRRVEAARSLLVPPLPAAVVVALVPDDTHERGPVLADLAAVEAGAHRDGAQIG